MDSPRLPRFNRVLPEVPLQLTARDREIIRLVGRHRFLRSPQIITLIGGSAQQVLRHLQLLYHHGYLERPRAQIDCYHQGGSQPIVYGLGNKGARLLKQEGALPKSKIHWGEKNRVIRRLFLDHALLISEIMVGFELACRNAEGTRLVSGTDLAKSSNREAKPWQWKVKMHGGQELGLVPDQGFAVESVKGNPAIFFLEADRGTMPVMRKTFAQTSFFRKLVAYQATWEQGIHQSKLGLHRFRVLTVTTSKNRVDSLLEACTQLERGHGLFLFTDVQTLREHGSILTLPWRSGKNGETVTLME